VRLCENLRGFLSRAERSRWRETVTSVGVTTTRERISPLGECVRCLTGEIGVKISRVFSAGLSGLGETGLRQMGLTAKREHTCPLEEYVRRLCGEIVVKISRDIIFRHYVELCANTEQPREA
jgi:hypothetical protein